MRHVMPVMLAAAVAACHQVTPQEKAAQDARDVAQVEAAQELKPPIQPLNPEPVSPAVRKVFKLSDAGCEFRTDPRPGANPVVVTGQFKAVLLLGGEPAIFAADSGSAELAAGTHEKYIGRTHWARLTRAPDTLTLYDRYERVVYRSPGTLACHGGKGSPAEVEPRE